jgi:hypothetical protein
MITWLRFAASSSYRDTAKMRRLRYCGIAVTAGVAGLAYANTGFWLLPYAAPAKGRDGYMYTCLIVPRFILNPISETLSKGKFPNSTINYFLSLISNKRLSLN